MEFRIILSLVFIGITGLLIYKTRIKTNTSIPGTELRINLLPYYYKKIGLITTVLSLVFLFILNFTDPYNLKDFTLLGISLGLSVICLSKERIEDEMIIALRMNTFFKSFYFSLFGVIIYALLNKLVGGQLSDFSIDFPLSIMSIVYLSAFHQQKKLLANS